MPFVVFMFISGFFICVVVVELYSLSRALAMVDMKQSSFRFTIKNSNPVV